MKKLLLIASMFALSACSTVDSLKPGSGRMIKVEGTSYENLWKVANRVVSQQLAVVSSDKASGTIKAEKSAGMSTWGEVIGVFIVPATEGASAYTVEVVSKKRSSMQITGQNWEETIVTGIKSHL